MVNILLSFVISCVLVYFMLPYVLVISLRKRLIDPIDERKVHNIPASRLGGITFFPAIIFSVWLSISLSNILFPYITPMIHIDVKLILLTLSLLVLFMIGIYDDIIGASYRSKFVVQIFSAILLVATGTYFKTFNGLFGIDEIPMYVGIPVTLFFYVFVTNAINLIDGIDGLASMLSMMALLAYAILLGLNGQNDDCLIAVATFGALMPFWYGNVFGVRRGIVSRIFMGDTGALVIGTTLGFLAVTIWNISLNYLSKEPIGQIYYILAFTMLLVPCFDVVRVIIHRFLAHKPLFLPDKNHIHHKFMALGYSPRKSLFLILCLNVIFVIINLVLSSFLNFTYIVIIDIVIWTVIHILLTKRIKLKQKMV